MRDQRLLQSSAGFLAGNCEQVSASNLRMFPARSIDGPKLLPRTLCAWASDGQASLSSDDRRGRRRAPTSEAHCAGRTCSPEASPWPGASPLRTRAGGWARSFSPPAQWKLASRGTSSKRINVISRCWRLGARCSLQWGKHAVQGPGTALDRKSPFCAPHTPHGRAGSCGRTSVRDGFAIIGPGASSCFLAQRPASSRDLRGGAARRHCLGLDSTGGRHCASGGERPGPQCSVLGADTGASSLAPGNLTDAKPNHTEQTAPRPGQ